MSADASSRPGSGPDAPPVGAEASSWNECYEGEELPYWDLGECSPPLLAFLREGVLPAPGIVLVTGCGTGHELPVLERAGHTPIGIDFAPRAVLAARERLAAERCERARVVQGDVVELDLARLDLAPPGADWVFDQTCFCALRPAAREPYARTLASLLRPGAELWGLNMRTERTDRPPFDSTLEEYARVFGTAGFTVIETRPLFEESLERRRGRETLLRFRLG